MSHANAPLTPTGRLRLARCVVDDGWGERRAAERFQVSVTTVRRWVARYRQHGEAGMVDRSSRPHRQPRLTSRRKTKTVLRLRRRGWGPARIAPHVGLAASTVGKILRREGAPRLCDLDLATRQELRRQAKARRYEHPAPGDLVHVDVKKLGRIPKGGGHLVHGRARGTRNSRATTPARKNGHVVMGYAYLHTALDDHSRLAYTEIHSDETAPTAVAFWTRAVAWFAARGVNVRRVLTDNGSCYRSRTWHATCTELGITPQRTRPYRPQTNGKVERYHRTLLLEWAYARPYRSEAERAAALPRWQHIYNHHRHHTALNGQPPASRIPNLCGEYS